MAGLTLSNKEWFDFNMNMADEVERLESPQLNWMDVANKSSVSWAGTPAQTDFAKRNQIVENSRNAIKEFVATSDAAPNDAYGQTQMAYVIAATNPGMDIKDALKIAQGGLLQKELNLQYEKKGGFGASIDTFRNGYWNARAGEAFSLYLMDPTNEDALKLAEKYYDKALSFKTAERGYSWFTDNVLMPYARISGVSAPGSVGATAIMIGGKVLSAVTGYGWLFDIAKVGSAIYSGTRAGMSQAGMDFYAMYKEADANGQKLDMTDPTVRTLFLTDAIVMGLVEVGDFFWSPTYRMMTNILTPTKLGKAFAKSFWQGVRYTGGQFILSDISESLEELVQGITTDAIKNAIYNWSNEHNGTVFPIKGWEDIVLDASSAFAQTTVEMLPTVALNTALSIGFGAFHAGRASKNQKFTFDPNKKQGVINSKYIVGSQTIKAEVKAEEEKAKESGTPQQKASSDEKVDSIKVVQTEAGGAMATAEDRENLKELYRRNGGKDFDVLVEGVGIENISSDTRGSSLNTFSLYINNAVLKRDGVVGYSEETGTIVVEDEKTKDEVKESLSKLSDLTEADNDYLVSPFSKGTATRVRVITQEQATEEGLATKAPSDWSFLNMKRQNAFRMSEQEYLDQEDAIDSFATIVSKITGQKAEDVRRLLNDDPDAISMALPEGTTWENLVASANFMPILSRITGRTSEDLLNSGDITFDVTGRTQYVDRNTNQNLKYDEQTKKVYRIDKNTGERIEYDPGDTKNVARAGAEMGATKDGNRKKYTVRIHKDALADDIVHELMHVARAMASKERLAGFIAAYGAQDLWTDDIVENEDGTFSFNGNVYTDRAEVFNLARENEEKFVRDFMNYLATGEAPNAQVKTFFDRLKRFLREVVQRFRDNLSEKTVDAFDKLLNGELDVQPGQTIEEAAEASEATLTDEMSEEQPQWETNDYSDDEEMYDEEGNPLYSLQRATSAGTSVPNQIPKGYGSDMDYLRNWAKKSFGADIFLPGQTNFEQGMGISDTATRFLSRRKGIESLGTDPFNRTREYNERVAEIALNRKFDTSSAMNVLNVIDSDEAMELVIAQSALPLKENGVAVFQIFHGDQAGQGQYKKDDAQYQRNMKGNQYVPHVEKFYNKVESRGDYIIAQNPKMDAVNEVTGGKFDFSAAEYGVVGKPFKNANGSTISRSKYGVGKQVGNQIYVHKEYASDVVPADLVAKAEALLPEGFEYNTLMYDTKKPGVLRFDQAPDFDTAREPIPGDMVTVNAETGEVKRSHSDQIWHHKWEWVKNDYMGFNVKESYDWSKKWTAKISDIKGIGSRRVWEEKLEKAGLKPDREVLYSLSPEAQRQYDDVVAKYRDTDQWLKAPNGNPTNLTEQQWVMVRTPNFIRWFGDWINDPANASKVVDENGEPKVVYHWRFRIFDVFDMSRARQSMDIVGAYFSDNPTDTAEYGGWTGDPKDIPRLIREGKRVSAFLNIRNPIRNPKWDYGVTDTAGLDERNSLLAQGYDGAIRQYAEDEPAEYIAFNSNQIKSATDNNGDFSTEDDSILHSLAENKHWQTMDANTQRRIEADYERTREQYYGTDKWMKAPNGKPTNLTERQWIQVRTPAFKEWFGDWENDPENSSKILDENGEPLVVYHGSLATFDTFLQTSDIGYHFGTRKQAEEVQQINAGQAWWMDEEELEANAKIYGCFLNIRNPLTGIEDYGNWSAGFGPFLDQLLEKGVITEGQKTSLEAMRSGNKYQINKQVDDALKKILYENGGYDGIVYVNEFEGTTPWRTDTDWGYYYDNSYIAFNSNQIKSATDNAGTFSADNDSILFSLNTEQQAERLYSIKQDTFSEVEEYINTLPEAERDRINKNFEAYKGSPWYYQTLSAALTRRDMEALINGGDIPSNSFLYKAAKSKDGTYAVIEALKKGPEGVFSYVSSHSLIANSEKALFAVNGSTLDCNPTPECAQFCYVTNGQMAYPTAIIKAEMVALAIRLDPIKAARMAAYQYKFQAGYDTKLVMRMFDRGDFSAEYVPFIKELNRQGVGVQIFTKRPDFLYEIDRKRNVVMMSVDHSNVDMIDKYPDLPIAVVFQGKEDVAMIESLEERFKKHKGVILPVKIGREYVSNEDIMALPQWARVEFTCNIDRGLKTIENWNCRKCDLNGINGCFFGRGVKNRELVGRSIEDISIGEIYDIIGSLKDRSNATEELIARGIDLRNPLFGRVLDELLALRNRELERADGRTANQTGAESSADTGRESETAPERRLVEEHNHAIEEFAKESNLPVAELDGVEYIKTDPSFDYSEDYLRSLKDETDRQLELFDASEYGEQPELQFGEPLSARNSGARTSGLRPGLQRFFSFRYGWNKQEPSVPSINQQWDSFGYIDFTNTKIRGYRDLAKLWSIYRNPRFEYFHIVFTKDDTIVGSLALSTGIVGRTVAVLDPKKNSAKIAERMTQYGADGYYLLHNHPSGNPDPSPADRNVTQAYKMYAPGFKGHIILDHNKYTVLTSYVDSEEYQTTGFHEIKNQKDSKVFSYNIANHNGPEDVAVNYMQTGATGTNVVFLRWKGDMAYATPESIIPFDMNNMGDITILQHPQAKISTWAMIITDNRNEYESLVRAEKDYPGRAADDIIYIDRKTGTWRSAVQERILKPIVDSEGNRIDLGDKVAKDLYKRRGDAYFAPVFETGNETLFSLSPERQTQAIQARKDEIRRAVEAGIFVRTEYLNEFRGEDWVQDELDLRDWMAGNPETVALARNSETFEKFKKAFLNADKNKDIVPEEADLFGDEDEIPFDEAGLIDDEDDEIPFDEDFGDEEEQAKGEQQTLSDSWLERIFGYAHALSTEERDRRFANEWTSSEDKTLELAKTLANYSDAFWNPKPRSRSGGYWYTRNVWGSFKGVSTKLLRLRDGKSLRTDKRERSTSEEIQEVQKLIRENPRPYRNAYTVVMAAESRAAQVNAGMQSGIGEDADWMLLEQIDDDIYQEIEKLEEQATETTATRGAGVDYKTKYQDLKQKMKDATRDLEKANTDLKTALSIVRSELETAKTNETALKNNLSQAEKDLADAEKEYSKLIERLDGKIENLQEQNAEYREKVKKAKALEKQLEDRRARVKELRTQLTGANREVKRLTNALNARDRYIEAKKASDYRKRRIRQILRLADFNSNTLDASFEESLIWIANLFERDPEVMEGRRSITEQIATLKKDIEIATVNGEDVSEKRQQLLELQRRKKESEWKEPPAQLASYLPEGYVLRADNRPSSWSAQELDILLGALLQMRLDAKEMLDQKQMERMNRLKAVSYSYFRQAFGRDAELSEEGTMSISALKQDLLANIAEIDFNPVKEKSLSYKLYKAKIQRLARLIDGDKEGVVYDWFVRKNYQRQTEELRGINRRLDLGDKVWKELGMKNGELAKEGFKGEKANGTKYSLTRGQMIGVYVYSQSDLGMEKLTSLSGNGIAEEDIEKIVASLNEKEIAWANFLLAEMQSNYGRLAGVFYNVWNQNLGQRPAYFPLVSSEAKTIDAKDADFLCGQVNGKDGKAYVDKGFTKECNPNALYPLKLDVTATWNQQVRRQEHFIAYGEWARDSQYLLDRGQLGEEIKRAKGNPYFRELNKIVNHVISNYITTGTDFDRTIAKYFSARNAAALTASISTAIKQAGSIGAVFADDIAFKNLFAGEGFFRNFLKANAELNAEYGDVKDVKDFIYYNAPDIRNRRIDFEVMAYLNRVYGGAVSNAIQKTTDKIMKYTTGLVDRAVVERLWLARYYTEFENLRAKGKTQKQAHAEAVFKASQLISETQPTSMRMDQSALQIEAQKSSLLRMISVFTNQAMNTSNMILLDVPGAFRQKNWKKVVGTVVAATVNVGIVALVSGRFVKKGDEDDKEYAWRFVRELLGTVAQTVDPIFGGNLLNGIMYPYSSSSYLSEFTEAGGVLRNLMTPNSKKTKWEKWSKAIDTLGTEALNVMGIPAGNLLERPIKAITNKNAGYLLNSTWGQIVESYK